MVVGDQRALARALLLGIGSTDLTLRYSIFVLCQARMLDQTGQLFQVLEALLESWLSQFAKRKLIGVVTDLFQDRIEMILVENELHKALGLERKLALGFFYFLIVVIVFLFYGTGVSFVI